MSSPATAPTTPPTNRLQGIAASLPNGDRNEAPYAEAPAADRLLAIVAQIAAIQERIGPKKDGRFVSRWPELGSLRTWKRLKEGDSARLDLEEWLPRYRRVLSALQASGVATRPEEIYDDLSATMRIKTVLTPLLDEAGKSRVVVIEGPSGSGKTEGLRRFVFQHPSTTLLVEAAESWESLNSALGKFLRKAGITPGPSASTRLDQLIDEFQRQPRLVLIDEAEHLTTRVLNCLKTLVNETGAKFALFANPTKRWQALMATPEAEQIRHNRGAGVLILDVPTAEEVYEFITRRFYGEDGAAPWPKADPEWTKLARQLSLASRHQGYWSFIRKTVDKALAESRRGDAPELTWELAQAAALHVEAALAPRATHAQAA